MRRWIDRYKGEQIGQPKLDHTLLPTDVLAFLRTLLTFKPKGRKDYLKNCIKSTVGPC